MDHHHFRLFFATRLASFSRRRAILDRPRAPLHLIFTDSSFFIKPSVANSQRIDVS
jgi:hypothetical protein